MALCPSFSTYSSGTMADIAARVVEELRNEPHPDTVNLNLFHWTNPNPNPQIDSSVLQSPKTEHPEEDEFEFAFVTNGSPISADQIFSNGLIKPAYPVFNGKAEYANSKPKKTGRTPLGKLMMTEERETTTSSSDDLTPGTYCVWAPQKLPEKCNKSKSTGSSMRWKLRELLHRSNSDGKDNLVKISGAEKFNVSAEDGAAARGFAKSRSTVKRRTYLPYKQDLVGLLPNVNGLGRNLRPF